MNDWKATWRWIAGAGVVSFVLSCMGTARAQESGASRPATQSNRPNVVLFLADDQGWGDLGYHGNTFVRTPRLDSFAREAVELTRFHVNPVCAPTRASLMTGRYTFRTGVTDVFGDGCQMDPAEVTVAQMLHGAGYATGIFGKWHLGDEGPRAPNAHGFDEALVFRGAAMRGYFDPPLLHNGKEEKFSGYCMDIFTNAAIEFIRKNRSKPFFVYLPTSLIHTPLSVSDEAVAPFKAAGLDQKTSRICGMLTSVDDNFGRLRATLKELGLEENTLLIYTSDNGPCAGSMSTTRFMSGLHGLKGTVYENGIRVPCFMRWPARFSSPAKTERLTTLMDILPTILDACGVPAPTSVKLDGMSLLPLLKDPAAAWPDRTIFFQWDGRHVPRRGLSYAALTERWKLVQPVGLEKPSQQIVRDWYVRLCKAQGRGDRSIEGKPRYELYDVAADPGETKDLAAAHPEIVERMKQQYERWFDDVCSRWNNKPN